MSKWLGKFPLQTERTLSQTYNCFWTGSLSKIRNDICDKYLLNIYYVTATVLVTEDSETYTVILTLEKITAWCKFRGRMMTAYNQEPYLDQYKVIINYYIILLQGSLRNKESDFYLLSSLSLKSWIMTLQRYLNNPKESSTEC